MPGMGYTASRLLFCSMFAFAAFVMIGCRSSTATTRPASTRPSDAAPSRPDWPAASRLLAGFDLGEIDGDWHLGDRVLLGVRSERASRVTVRYLLVELVEGIDEKTRLTFNAELSDKIRQTVHVAPPSRRTRLTVFDESGKQLARSDGTIPDRLLNNGLFGLLGNLPSATAPTTATAPATVPTDDTISLARIKSVERAVLALMALVQFSASQGSNSAITSMVREVIDTPSLWSLLTRRPTLSINAVDAKADTARFADRDWRVAAVALDLSFNDELILNVEARAVESRPPIGLVSGIFKAEGHHPTDSGRSLTLELLAAKRGTGVPFRAYTIR